MKKIVCELCESTSFVKEGGMFVCQGCGTKYSAEEARGMMREVADDAAPAAPAAPVVSVPMGNPNQAQIDNLLVLATTAYEAQNYAEAENYCNRAIEYDATCFRAWNLKGKAVGWQSKIANLRIEEAAHSFCKAIDFAPQEEKEDIKNQAAEELKRLGLALIDLRKNRFSNSPDDEELQGFKNDRMVLLNAILVLLKHGNAVGIPDGYLEEIATKMNLAAVAALNMARAAWNKVDHPTDKDLTTYINWCSNMESLLRLAIDASKNDDEADIVRYKNLAIVLEEPIGKHSQKQEWSSYQSRYIYVNSRSLSDEAVKIRRRQIDECRQKVRELEKAVKEKKAAEAKAAEEAKQQRIAAYWAAHQEEKDALDAEQKSLEEKKAAISNDIAEISKQIDEANAIANNDGPAATETNKLKEQIKGLEERRSGLGLFAGKEKKQINEEIASLNGRIDSLKGKVAEEKAAFKAEAEKAAAPLKAKKDELDQEIAKIVKRIAAIKAELTKDPEE